MILFYFMTILSIKNLIKKIYNFILDFIFPIECLGCNQEDAYLCPDCLKKIKIYNTPPPFEHPLVYLNGIISAADYNQRLLQDVIHHFKFRFIQELAEPLAKILAEFWQNYNGVMVNPLIIPVPLNKKRLLERGFNQSELIALLFANRFNYTLLTDVVIRSKNTAHQVGLNKKNRLANVQNAFQITDIDAIKNQTIILIDDVVTTGSTLEEIAKILKAKGAKEVWGLTVAKD